MEFLVNIKGELYDLSIPRIMGIINVTPDSFYSKSRYTEISEIENIIQYMIREEVDIIDIGGFSSRPGAEVIDEDEEKERLKPALELIKEKFSNCIVSIDTCKSSIAGWAIENYGVNIINDISAGKADSNMFSTIAEFQVPYVLMHMRGTPLDMQKYAIYNNITQEVIYEISERIYYARSSGINDIIIDPGFGFAKTPEQNFELLANLECLNIFKLPLLVGISRKSMIYRVLQITPEEALHGTTALHMVALSKGAHILRVHDVREARQVVKLFSLLKNAKSINHEK